MQFENLSPACGSARNELAAALYDELDPAARATLERHLASCTACRDELAVLRETQKLLGRWELTEPGEDPHAIARGIRAGARRPRSLDARRVPWIRISAVLSGAAAALLFVLCVLHTDASYASGRLQLSFAPPWSPASDVRGPSGTELDSRLREIAAQEVANHAASLEQNQQELFQRLVQMNQEEFLRLSRAVDLARAQDQHDWGTRFDALTREAAREDARTRQALIDLAGYVVPTSSK